MWILAGLAIATASFSAGAWLVYSIDLGRRKWIEQENRGLQREIRSLREYIRDN